MPNVRKDKQLLGKEPKPAESKKRTYNRSKKEKKGGTEPVAQPEQLTQEDLLPQVIQSGVTPPVTSPVVQPVAPPMVQPVAPQVLPQPVAPQEKEPDWKGSRNATLEPCECGISVTHLNMTAHKKSEQHKGRLALRESIRNESKSPEQIQKKKDLLDRAKVLSHQLKEIANQLEEVHKEIGQMF